MNALGKALGLFLTAGLALSCRMPVMFQEPMAGQGTPAWHAQGRFRPALPDPNEAYPASNQAAPAVVDTSAQAQEPLQAWSGGVVPDPKAGVQTAQTPPAHGLEPSVDGRMHIIELYQEVLDERDGLADEVRALQTALARTQETLDAERMDAATRETRLSALEERSRALLEENRDLAARLTTAQVRRLEAEKLLLETQIAWRRERQGSPRPAAPAADVRTLPGDGQ